jgi:transcriptional regulator with XRE-family HTH domain
MNAQFPRILALLRAERHISQKQAAADLGISQALLSHYEKGIRECGLDFVVRVADYYDVSCDYLLGRSADRSGLTLTAEDLPEAAGNEKAVGSAGLQIVLNKKLIVNSMNILFDALAKAKNRALVTEVSSFLMLAVYRMFRVVHSTDPKNPDGMFAVPAPLASGYCAAAMQQCETNASVIASGEGARMSAVLGEIGDITPVPLTTTTLSESYPLYAASLLNLVKNAEEHLPTEAKKK